MCFSATASFVVSGTLLASGALVARKARRPNERLLSYIPILFGIQQLAEGLVWVGLRNNPTLESFGSLIFILFAYVLWPIYIPVSLALVATEPWRKKALQVLSAVGALTSILLSVQLLLYPIQASIFDSCCVRYLPTISGFATTLYVIAVCGSLIVSRNVFLRLAGILAAASLILVALFYPYTVASTWCFFAALLSLLVALKFFTEPRSTLG